ncbi:MULTISPECIES: hypothetical protein [unclassified Exiguobacterium]|uniref:hypothetical protein n=1 Tax=unclassified Exiguobacterium TaxID=2644629 RepID=UPI00103C8D96|nr:MULTISPECIES: hypothetical protein [unclassified Exiguobacterium]TCI39586.1 hypothetical protein EVJ29_02785 [Exiguobacterium sp. SH4S7]TCI61454.1 hypothetical protein EVJ21_09340 [Exiguobacterium sp. SH0S2]
MSVLKIDPETYDVFAALPTYFREQSPFYIEGSIEGRALIEVVGYGIVAEVEIMLVETTTRPDDRYWRTRPDDEVRDYCLVDLVGLDFHHPLLKSGMYDVSTSYATLKDMWDRGYQVPSQRWTRQTYETHLARERMMMHRIASVTACTSCGVDLIDRYGAMAHRLLEYHLEGDSGMWVCPTCHKAIHHAE